MIGCPIPLLEHPCRKIVFTIKSRDQGWGGDGRDRGTYHGSWTWFEAGLERWTQEGINGAPLPSLDPRDLSTEYPVVVRDDTGAYDFDNPLLPLEHLKIQCNQVAINQDREHVVVWTYTDDIDPEKNEAAADELSARGRGKATGNGKFVRSLRLGDIVTVWGKQRFPGWLNYVSRIKVDVYWAL